ncbi:MAG: pyridoxamine 5'-phosphate oxidase family protein [Chloroflexota bacterium]|nr:MAG: pyridoxamine 5'-phosphate oxidase family protein [Chloroflexota bacterium]
MVALPPEVVELIKDKGTLKLLATTDEHGNPHAVVKGSLTVLDDGHLAYRETLESSQTNSNLLRSIWFDKKVAVTIVGANRESYQIKGKPYRYVINGSLYKEFYLAARERGGPDSELAGVWLIAPEEVRTQSSKARKEEEERKHPHVRHYDRAVYLSREQSPR